MNRRGALLVATLVVFVAGIVALIMRSQTDGVGGDASTTGAVNSAPNEPPIPPTSEALIAEALTAGDISYEESLLQRAYAIYGDPRLEPAFQSPIVDWEIGDRLFNEVAKKEPTLSKTLLDSLVPFRVRPNDPRSVFNQPRAEVLPAQNTGTPPRWESYLVPGTDLRIWIEGDRSSLETTYSSIAMKVWDAFSAFFPHPDPDDGNGNEVYNPDPAVDVYLVRGNSIDPRRRNCLGTNPLPNCTLYGGGDNGRAPEAAPFRRNRSSGYVLADVDQDPDDLTATIAHELAHVTQHNYDNDESQLGGISEATAHWVEYKVLKSLKIAPSMAYAYLGDPPYLSQELFRSLNVRLSSVGLNRASWLFYYYASMQLGNDVVTRIWEEAQPAGLDGIRAVNKVVPFEQHFPQFALQNWNQDPVVVQYKNDDGTFPRQLKPIHVVPIDFPNPGMTTIAQPVQNLSTRYYKLTFGAPVRRVMLRNPMVDNPNAHVWGIKEIGGQWKEPEDWSRNELKMFCRDQQDENITTLVLIVSHSKVDDVPDFQSGPRPDVVAEDVGCPYLEGTAQSTLRLRDDRQDVTYTSSRATLRFRPRTVQDQPGNVQYDLMPTSVTWTVTGTEDGCTVDGQTVVTIPAFLDQPLDPTRPAYGYLNVVGVDGGDFHSVMVSAGNPGATYTKTCPGDPPRITQEAFRSGWLLQILSQMNTHTGTAVAFKGTLTFDPDRFQDALPPVARDLLMGTTSTPTPPQLGVPTPTAPGGQLPGLGGNGATFPNLPTGIDPAAIEAALQQAREALRQADLRPGRMVYTFTWDLKPMTGTPP